MRPLQRKPMKSKTIAIAINSSWNILNFRSGLVRALVDAGYEVLAIAPRDAFSERLSELGCHFVPIEMSARGTSPVQDTQLFLAYRRVLRHHRPDVLLGYTIKPNIYGSLAAQALGIPVINNIAGLGITFLKGGLFQAFVRTLYRTALRRSRTVFFQNLDDRTLFLDAGLVREDQTRLLPGSGVDLARFQPQLRTREQDSRFAFLLVSRLLRSKGILDYVAAAETLHAEFPNADFRVAGIAEPDHPEAIRVEEVRRWDAEGTVTYLGALDDVRPALAEADAMVLPTFYPEGTPRALLEAAAMAKPIITTAVPGCRDVVDEGINGFLCQPRDSASLAAAMRRMLRLAPDELRAMGTASRRKAEDQFDERIVVQRYLAAIDDALASRP
jgi:glycosyltransferase involved in cell wall biosynthesis